jgi:nitroimidazol reductase NimA-like FMN-containing flavoprotein (pyridoxamine 5'-phosphate oxidase superfamily)
MRAIFMEKTSQLKEFLKDLFASQRLAVLATQSKGQPYGNLVAFVATNDLKRLLFATTRATRKYANISENPRVSMVIDNRSNRENDFHQAAAVTVTGVVKEVEGLGKGPLLRLYLSKHPYLKDFVSSPTCALLRMHVETYYVVRQFQNVMELHIRK